MLRNLKLNIRRVAIIEGIRVEATSGVRDQTTPVSPFGQEFEKLPGQWATCKITASFRNIRTGRMGCDR